MRVADRRNDRPSGIARRGRPHLARRAHRGGGTGQAHERRGHPLSSKSLLGDSLGELIVVPLPDYPGPHDVMHLMSFVSPVDRDLAVVFSRCCPMRFRRHLSIAAIS